MGYKLDHHGASIGSACGCIVAVPVLLLACGLLALPLGAPGVWERTTWLELALAFGGAILLATGVYWLVKRVADWMANRTGEGP